MFGLLSLYKGEEMFKEKTVVRNVTIKTYHCDVCGKRLHRKLQCSQAICEYCGKELCDKCVANEMSTDGDYRETYCEKCWNIAKPYHDKINTLEDEMERLAIECDKKCKGKS